MPSALLHSHQSCPCNSASMAFRVSDLLLAAALLCTLGLRYAAADYLPVSAAGYDPNWLRNKQAEQAWPVGTAVDQCDPWNPILNQTVYFADCVEQPCKVADGETLTVKVVFSPSQDSAELRVYTYKVYDTYKTPAVELNGQMAVIKPSPNSVFESTLTNSDGSNAEFPLKKHETYTWTLDLHIPPGKELDSYLAEWNLINEYNEKMVCFKVFRHP